MNLNEIETEFLKQFPNGHFVTAEIQGVNGPYTAIEVGLIRDISDIPDHDRNNEPMHHMFKVSSAKKTAVLIKMLFGGINVVAEEQGNNAATISTEWRNIICPSHLAHHVFKTYFANLKKLCLQYNDDIYNRAKFPEEYFTF